MTAPDELAPWLRLTLIPGIGGETQRQLLHAFGLPEALVGISHRVSYRPVLFAALLKHHGQLGPAEIAPKRDWTYRQVLWLAHTLGVELQLPARHPFNPLALLRLALNPADDLAFVRAVEFLPLGIGSKTLESLRALARERSLPLLAALEQCLADKFNSRPLFSLLGELNRRKDDLPVAAIYSRLLEESGYLEMLREKEEEERLLNIGELREFIGKWEEENPGAPFTDLLDRMTLENRESRGGEKTQVFLLTMHNAKGLEFPTVIVSGINSAYMPFFLRKERDEIEEERRLFYVASTRASQLLVVSTASDRPSFFLQQVASSSYLPVYSFREIIDGIFPLTQPAVSKSEGKFIVHPVFGRGRIVEKISESKYLIHFSDSGNKLLDTSVVKVEFV